MRACDFVFAFPALLSAIMLTSTFGPGVVNAIVGDRRRQRADLRQADPRHGERGSGARIRACRARRGPRDCSAIAFDHVLPNIAPALIVQATIQFAIAILAEAALSYLGLGAQPPQPSWGSMLADAQGVLFNAPSLPSIPERRSRSACSGSTCSATACATCSTRSSERGR